MTTLFADESSEKMSTSGSGTGDADSDDADSELGSRETGACAQSRSTVRCFDA